MRKIICLIFLTAVVGCGSTPQKKEPPPPPKPPQPPPGPSVPTQQNDHPLPKLLRKQTKKVELCKHRHNTPESALIYRVTRYR